MASDLYLSKLTLHPGDDWYVGLEVTYECIVGCWNGACANCSAVLNIGMASPTSVDCGSTPDNFKKFAYKTVSVGCGQKQSFSFKHTVTQADIDRITSGTVRRACAFISRGMGGMCYEYDSLNVIDPPSRAVITVYEYPSEMQAGKNVNVFASVKNIGSGAGSFYLTLMDSSTEIHRVVLGTIAAGASVYNAHLWGIMPNRNWNLRIELWRG